MPTSNPYAITPIVTYVISLKPSSILDIGPGFGKYGVLFREYLDVWYWRHKPGQWRVRIDCIEACESYITPVHKHVYDNIYVEDVRYVDFSQLPDYDLICMINVIECMLKEEGKRVLEECLRKARKAVLVSTPDEWYGPRHERNPYESRLSFWPSSEMQAMGARIIKAHGPEKGMETYVAVFER